MPVHFHSLSKISDRSLQTASIEGKVYQMHPYESLTQILVIDDDREGFDDALSRINQENISVYWQNTLDATSEINANLIDVIIWAYTGNYDPQLVQDIKLLQQTYIIAQVYLAVSPIYVTDAANMLHHGVAGYLLHPYNSAELHQMLQQQQLRRQIQLNATLDRRHLQEHQVDHAQHLFNTICQNTAHLLEADSCCILRQVRDGKEDVLRIIGAFGLKRQAIAGTRDEIEKSIAGRVVAHKKPIIANNIPDDKRFENPAAVKDNSQAIACVPIWHDDEVIGTLDIHSQTKTHAFSAADVEILELIARQAAVAIGHAELFERYRGLTDSVSEDVVGGDAHGYIVEFNEHAERLLGNKSEIATTMRALFEISTEIAQIYEEKRILKKTVDVLVDVLGYRVAYFRLKDAHDKLVIRAGSGTTEKYINNPNYNLDIGQGVNGRVAQTGQLEAIHDVQECDDYFYNEIAAEQSLRGMLVVPMQLDKELLGTLCCYTAQPYHFTSEDKQLLTTFANLSAVTIERIRQFEEINTRAAELERLHNISQVISTELTLSEALNSIVDNILDLVGARDVHLYLYDSENDKLEFAASYWSTGERNIQVAVPRTNGLTHTVARLGEQIIINNPNTHNLFVTQDWPLTAIAGFPLKVGEKVVGVLNIAFENEGGHFNRKQINAIETIAGQAAIALANAQLFDEITRQVNELRALDHAGEKLASVVQLDDTLFTIAETAAQATGADGAYIALYDQAEKQFDLDRDAYTGIGIGVAIWDGKQPRPNNIIDQILKDEIVCVESVAHVTPQEIPMDGQQELLASGIEAFIGVRLNVEDNPAGILFLNYKRTITDWDKSRNEPFLRIFADQAAVAIERAQLFERLEQQQALGRVIAKTTGSVMDPWNAIAKEILKGAMQITGADRGYISAINVRSEQFEFVVHINDGQVQSGIRTTVNEHIENLVRSTKRSILIDDIKRNKWYRQNQPSKIDSRRSHLVVPIVNENGARRDVIGIIYLESQRPRAFHLNDLELLEGLADQATIAHQNAMSYEDARQQVLNLKLLLEITQWITSFRPIKDELKELAEELYSLHNFDLVTINVYDPYQQTFEPPIIVGEVFSIEPKLLSNTGSLKWRRLQKGPDEVFAVDVLNNKWLDDPFIEREKIVAAASLRLSVDEQIVGILGAYNRSAFTFDQTTKLALQKSAKLASGLIFHSSILQSIVDGLHGVMGFDVITLFIYNAVQEEFSIPVTAGEILVPNQWANRRLINEPLRQLIQENDAHFTDNSLTDPILAGDFVNRENIQASGFARLAVDGEIVGVLFVNWRHKHHWTQAEKYAVQLFADGAAIAIQNMQQVNAQEKNQRQLNALYEAGWAVVGAGLDLDLVLAKILELAVGETGAHFGTLQLIEPDNEHLSFEAVWPKEERERLLQQYGQMPIVGPGITTRAVRENDAQLVLDIQLDDDFVDVGRDTRSELAVIIRQDDKPLGVLNVEHKAPNAFTNEDRQLLIGFTNLTVLALQHAKQYQELEKAKNKQLATQAVAWLGLFGANWQHTINQKIFSISNYTTGLKRWLENQDIPGESREFITTLLENIDDVANSIRTVQIPGEVSENFIDSSLSRMDLDKQLPKIIDRWVYTRQDVTLEYHCQCPDVVIGISEQWFQVLMEKLINNALRAMPDGGKIVVSTELLGNVAQIFIRDTGHGIPAYARKYFLRQEIPRRDGAPGSGMGVLIANFVALCHDGELTLLDTGPDKGTTLLLKIPVVNNLDT